MNAELSPSQPRRLLPGRWPAPCDVPAFHSQNYMLCNPEPSGILVSMPSASAGHRRQSYDAHVKRLLSCTKCPEMKGKPVHGCVRRSRIISLGQAPGIHEERFGKPFAYTAGKTLFKWLSSIGVQEEDFRKKVNMSAVCRCFPGKASNGDRKPSRPEVENCMEYLEFEMLYHKPTLVIPIGKLAIDQLLERASMQAAYSNARFVQENASPGPPLYREKSKDGLPVLLNSKGRATYKLDQVIGRLFRSRWLGIEFDWIAFPHPSGLNVWNHTDAGKACIQAALRLLAHHPAMQRSLDMHSPVH